MVLVVSVREVLEDGTALKNANLLAVWQLVRQSGQAAVGVDLEEPGLLLLILHHLDGVDLRRFVKTGNLASRITDPGVLAAAVIDVEMVYGVAERALPCTQLFRAPQVGWKL